jgi:hypothetical protein
VPRLVLGDEGHEMVARIAAAHLSSQTRSAIALLLHQDADLASVAQLDEAMARAAIWPDHMPGGKGDTAPWH